MYSLKLLLENIRKAYEHSPTEETSIAMQLHIAMALSASIPVPADPNCSFSDSWIENGGAVREFLNDLNEEFIIDLELITKLVRENYRQRFNLVHLPEKELALLTDQTRKKYAELGGNDMLVDTGMQCADFNTTRLQVAQGLKLAQANILEKDKRAREGRE